MGDVIDIDELAWRYGHLADIPFKKVSLTTYPMWHPIPKQMMEIIMVQRKQKISIKPGKSTEPLAITHPNAARVDISSSSHYVSVPPDRDDEPVRKFSSFTVDRNALADWLDACGVNTP
jgi:hypothetical protein